MEFCPELSLGLFNGWLPLVLFYLVFGLLLAAFPRSVVSRLYERSGWDRRMKIMRAFGLIFMLSWFVLVIFSPPKIGKFVCVLGSSLYTLGLVGMVVALFNYKDTPLDRPVTRGLYSISRNPQQVTIFLAFLGISIAVGSLLAMLLISTGIVLGHARVLAEERACSAQYGEAYERYLKRVPRYFLFF
jgi:protein-S-isoprenylcysteine O-methyltransferase Ste14